MKILHTGDWHMGTTIGGGNRRVDLAPAIVANLERIAGYLEERAVDVMIIAGDIFCDRATRDDLKLAVDEINRVFTPFLARGGTIVAISGNHDSIPFLESLRGAIALAPPPAVAASDADGEIAAPGRAYFTAKPRVLRLRDKAGVIVQFLLMPYPNAQFLMDAEWDTASQQNRKRGETFLNALNALRTRSLRLGQRSVLVSHITVGGVEGRRAYKMTDEDDVTINANEFLNAFDYSAYGHIHKPGEVRPNAPHARYCGSIERLDFNEAHDEKEVVLLEIGKDGLVGTPECLPLPATPYVEFTIGGPGADYEAELAAIEKEWRDHPHREKALARCIVRYRRGETDAENVIHRISALFENRCYHTAFDEIRDGDAAATARPEYDLHDMATTARDYLKRQLADDDTRRDDLLTLLDELLQEEIAAAPVS